MALPRVAVFATGGTIAQAPDETGRVMPGVDGASLLAGVPGLDRLARVTLRQIVNIDSRDMQPEIWLDLAAAIDLALRDPAIAGAVVLHGTDTMEDTAYFLDRSLTGDKPVVLTGAMELAGSPFADGPQNIFNAVRQAVDPAAAGHGATVNFAGGIFAADAVRKVATGGRTAFDGGRLARLDGLGIDWQCRRDRPPPLGVPRDALPRVDIVTDYPGADGALLDAVVAAGAAGLVVEGYGVGNLSRPTFDAVLRARGAGLPVVIASRVAQGRLHPVYGGPGGGESLLASGAILGAPLTAGKNRILLMLGLAMGMAGAELQRFFAVH
ncbi:MAG: asparaginase [Sneathiellaceae bacterium]